MAATPLAALRKAGIVIRTRTSHYESFTTRGTGYNDNRVALRKAGVEIWESKGERQGATDRGFRGLT
jgi:hypothetical protein